MILDNTKAINQLQRFRLIGKAEGVSFLFLLLIAMPLKYIFHLPLPVKYTGWIHGALFIAYLVFAFEVFVSLNKNFFWLIKVFIAAFFPLGTFIFDKSLKKDVVELEKAV